MLAQVTKATVMTSETKTFSCREVPSTDGKGGRAWASPDGALQLDPRQQHGEGDVVLVQHAAGHAVERHLGQKQDTDGPANSLGSLPACPEQRACPTWKRSLVMMESRCV